MYEFTHAGFWVRWSSLDRPARRLLVTSIVATIVGLVPFSLWLNQMSYRAGYLAGSGGIPAPGPAPTLSPWAIVWLVAFWIAAGLLWWRFSLRQDEMFNRVQNWALAMSGAVTSTLLVIWSLFALTGAIGPVAALPALGLYLGLVLIFWFVAYRRWAA
jgi:hypothetical protein